MNDHGFAGAFGNDTCNSGSTIMRAPAGGVFFASSDLKCLIGVDGGDPPIPGHDRVARHRFLVFTV